MFTGLSLGTETFVDELRGASVESIHNNPVWFKLIFPWVTVLFSSVTLTFLVLVVSRFWANKTRFKSFTSERALVVLLFFGYTFFIILTDSYFDRYHIPLITLGMILCFQSLRLIPEFKFSILFPGVMLLFTYASVFGTKDYFTRTRKTWGAYSELCKNPAIDRSTINPGFEIYFWNDGGNDPALWDFFDKNKFTYVLEYEAPEGFIPFRTYKFQRYSPFVEDSLVVFKRGKLD
ncbi:MAG: hypothetical protein JNL60_18255 [Bacteroidia bacterium]|nr:hypothetical protein [Bacteroidia bacterium]